MNTVTEIPQLKEKITDEWKEEHAECDDNSCKVYLEDNPCLVMPNFNKTITLQMIEECCEIIDNETMNCRFESPEYKLVGYR